MRSAAAATELVEDLRGELGAGAAERVAERDRAAVHVQPIGRDAELARAVEGLRGERLVDLEEIDVRDLEPGLREELLDRGERADAHDRRVDADRDVRAEVAEALQAERLRLLGAHDERGGCAVRER
jgi:hypothetical protein